MTTIDKETVRKAIEANVIVGDGHTLFDPSFYSAFFDVHEMGLVRRHQSDGSPKGTIFVDGQPVADLEAVYNLEFLETLIAILDLPHARALGRGFAAREMVDTLKAWSEE